MEQLHEYKRLLFLENEKGGYKISVKHSFKEKSHSMDIHVQMYNYYSFLYISLVYLFFTFLSWVLTKLGNSTKQKRKRLSAKVLT